MPISLSSIIDTKHAAPPRMLLHGPEKVGKALAIDTKIPTPNGFTTMGNLKIGDEIFAGDGSVCTVLGATEVMYGRPCYKITLRMGQEIIADESHLWQTRCIANTTGKPSFKTTLEIKNTLFSSRNKTTKNHLIPWHNGTKTANTELPLDPYVLGVWLGDGNSSGASIYIADRDVDILNNISTAGVEFRVKRFDENDSSHTISLTGKNSYGKIKTILRELNILNNKHIPDIYINSGYEQRLQLLRGLMDTDGWVDKSPKSLHNFSTTTPLLAKTFYQLILSLGINSKMKEGRATLYGKDCGPMWTFSFQPKNIQIVTTAFKLKRALAKTSRNRPHQQNISSIIKVDSVPVRCIQVSSINGMFLVSESYVPTHNSTFMSEAPNPVFIQTEKGLKGIKGKAFPMSKSYQDVIDALDALKTQEHTYQSVIIDSADWLERLIHDKVCAESNVATIELAGGGYGKGYSFALVYWREIIEKLDYLNENKNMMVGLICHSVIVPFNDPEHEPYDRYEMKLHQPKKATGARDLLCEWADIIGFAAPKIYVRKKGEKGSEVKRGVVSGESNKLNLVGCPAFVAGNRYSLPARIDLNWDEFITALKSTSE